MQKISFLVILALSAISLLVGIFVIMDPIKSIDMLAAVSAQVLVIIGIAFLAFFLLCRNIFLLNFDVMITAIFVLACGGLIIIFHAHINEFLRYAVVGYFYVIGGINFILFVIYMRYGEKGRLRTILFAVSNGFIANFLFYGVYGEYAWPIVLVIFLAGYCFALGTITILNTTFLRNTGKRLYFPMPAWIESQFVRSTFDAVNSKLKRGILDDNIYTNEQLRDEIREENAVEILIHTAERGVGAIGHVDIVFGDKAYTYGNYDRNKKNVYLFGLIWNGTLAVCDRTDYLELCLDTMRKTVFSYKLDICPEDKETIARNIEAFMQNCEIWKPEAESKSNLAKALLRMNGSLYKINKGKFRTYFLLGTNCATLVEHIFKGTKLPKIKPFSNIIVPGSALRFLENELSRANGIVASRTIYVSQRNIALMKAEGEKVRNNITSIKELGKQVLGFLQND